MQVYGHKLKCGFSWNLSDLMMVLYQIKVISIHLGGRGTHFHGNPSNIFLMVF